jgi:hypothetical protein
LFRVQGAALDQYFALEGRRGELEGEAAALGDRVRRKALELRQGLAADIAQGDG